MLCSARRATNADLEKMVQTNNEWILDRTGISERHIAAPDVATSDLATCAAKAALGQRGIDASELDAIMVCTVTPDMLFPSTACLVQNNLVRQRPGDSTWSRPAAGSSMARDRARVSSAAGTAQKGSRDRRRYDEPHHGL